MKKRLLSLLLAAVMLVSVLQIPALAAEHPYGSLPILAGYANLDYMADQILAEIPLAGKDARGQIQAVYDWIILHCKRDNWDGTYYFDEDDVLRHTDAYGEKAEAMLYAGEAVIRPEWCSCFELDTWDAMYDSNYYVCSFAYEMMMTRTGNCAHYSALLAVLLGHLGYDCRLIGGEFINNNGTRVEHKWNYVLVNGQYYWLDVRMDHATYTRTGYVPHNYFMISSTTAWARSHSWDHTYSDLLAANAADIVTQYEQTTHIHTLEPVTAKAAACTENGRKAHYACTQCGQCFLDEEGIQPVNSGDLIIPALGHDWSEWTVTKASTHEESGTRQRVCKNDFSHVETEKTPALGNPFTDVPAGAFYETPVVWAVDNGITTGANGNTFSSTAPCTRAHAVTFLWRAAGQPEPEGRNNQFTDVAEDAYYAKAVQWAVEQGITTGMTDTTFGPQTSCTRAQIVTFLWRAAGRPEPTGKHGFSDIKSGAYYEDAVIWAVKNGITTGTGDTTFSPSNTCPRAQVVTFLYRALA